MAYFSNGSEGADYAARYCDHCVNQSGPDGACFILSLHYLRNYEDCDKKDSILHVLIPRSKDGITNEQCIMFTRVEAK